MKSLRLEKDKRIEKIIIKDIRNSFRVKKEINGTAIKGVRNLCKLKKKK